jgi:hypothetical protein
MTSHCAAKKQPSSQAHLITAKKHMSNLIRAYLTPRKEARLLSQTVNAQEKNAEEPSSRYHIYKQLVRLTKHDISYQEIS